MTLPFSFIKLFTCSLVDIAWSLLVFAASVQVCCECATVLFWKRSVSSILFSCCFLELKGAAILCKGFAIWGRVPLSVWRVLLPVCRCRCLFEGAAGWGRVSLPVVRVALPVEGCHCLSSGTTGCCKGEHWSLVVHALSISAVGVSFVKLWGFVLIS